jgi:hypothetical protein
MLLFATEHISAQTNWNHISMEDVISRDTITKKGFTLIFINKAILFDSTVKRRMEDAFFTVYPKQATIYNSGTLKKVIFVIDPEYKGVAAAAGGIVRYNPEWFAGNPRDIDVVTHEVMHIVQSYPDGAGPGWLTEGIADYVRFTLGVDNKGASWELPEYEASQSYTDAYRVTARFLVWAEKHYGKGLVKQLDASLRSDTYKPELWVKISGKTLDDLWKEYAGNPVI